MSAIDFRQMFEVDQIVFRCHDKPFDKIGKLADVTREGVCADCVEGRISLGGSVH